MDEILYLSRKIAERCCYAFLFLVVLYNPWFSLSQWFMPANGDGTAGWPFKLIALLMVGGALYFFTRVTKNALGVVGMGLIGATLALIAFIPFYLGIINPTFYAVINLLYFFILPILLGFGLSAGFFTRWATGTLLTSSVNPTSHHNAANVAAAHQQATHGAVAETDHHHN